MTPTRPLTLIVIGAVCAALSWLVVRISYTSFPPLPWSAVPATLLLAVAEVWSGRYLRSRIRGIRVRPRARDLDPMAVARMAVLAKASSHAAAAFGGFIAGFLIYVSGMLDKPILRGDAITAAVTLASALALIAAALYLEHCCRAPEPPGPPDDGEVGDSQPTDHWSQHG